MRELTEAWLEIYNTERLMAEVSGSAKLVFFEHSGHLLQWTEPEKFNTELLVFTREVLGQARPDNFLP